MGTTAASVLDQRLSQLIDDWIEEIVTTAINADNSVVCTTLNEHDDGNKNTFKNFYCYFTDEENATKDRKVYDYNITTGTLSVRGAVLADDGTDTATFRLYRYSYTAKQRAINDAIRELSGVLFKRVDDRTLVAGNMLPNSHFEDVDSSSEPTHYEVSGSGATLATDATNYFRSGARSAKLTRAGTDCHMYISDVEWQRLLDLMGRTLNFRCWAYASNASQARLTVYTNDKDGTTQTENSSYHTGGGTWELLEIESFAINDDITDIEFRFSNNGNDSSVYYDNARVMGAGVYEYLLPDDFQDGEVAQVYIQSFNYSEYPCDDLMPNDWDRVFTNPPTDDGTYRYLRMPYTYALERQIRLVGTSPLSELSTFSGTTEIDGREVNLLLAYAAYCLFRNEEGVPSSEDKERYESKQSKWLREYYRLLPSLGMVKPKGTLNLPRI